MEAEEALAKVDEPEKSLVNASEDGKDVYETENKESKKQKRRKHLERIRQDHSATLIQSSLRGAMLRRKQGITRGVSNATVRNNNNVSINNTADVMDGDDEEPEQMVVGEVDETVESSLDHAAVHAARELLASPSKAWPKSFYKRSLQSNANAASGLNLSQKSDVEIRRLVRESQQLVMRTVTWNLMAKKPPVAAQVRKHLIPLDSFHIIAVGSEECERTIAQSAILPGKNRWEKYLRDVVGDSYIPIRSQTLQAIHLIIFVHKSLVNYVTNVRSGAVPTGLGNIMGNKGGVGISFEIFGSSIVISNSHLAAHQHAVTRRNEDFSNIEEHLPIVLAKAKPRRPSSSTKSQNEQVTETGTHSGRGDSPTSISDLSSGSRKPIKSPLALFAQHSIIMGDFNYRVRGEKGMVEKLIAQGQVQALLDEDQLTWAQKNELVMVDFLEAPLLFKPTYKFDKNSDSYDTGPKQRIPAWTDRILYKPGSGLQCIRYDSAMALRTSDHRPVFADFLASVAGNDNETPIKDDKALFTAESQVCTIM